MIRLFAISVIFMVSGIVNLTDAVGLIEVIKSRLSSRNLKRSEILLLVRYIFNYRDIKYMRSQ